ncbi:alcohol oxidase [Setomelanomma holmii]|uniref:Alcohol oxidase n=1 Tax=Setomelanomma holmii TaxID=210430 RepID=A0A9P4H748_9PLEO|nr:alcohol oxidase [Setomelanomma holmii]
MVPSASRALLAAIIAAKASAFAQIDNKTYEYIVVGSRPGAGHSVLLLEAGDDQTENLNVLQSINFNAAGNDPATRWDFFVRHSDDDVREARYLHRTWRKPDGDFFVGNDPPAGSKPEGIYYPHAGTLGGCAMHNGCLTMNPNDADWDEIAELTGDESWSHENMRKYLIRPERVHYNSISQHGHNGWLDMTISAPAAQAAGFKASDTSTLLQRDMNSDQPNRDNLVGPFGRRYNARDTASSGKYPLTISLDTLAIKIIFKKTGNKPKASGVEYLQGKSMYSADPRYNAADKGVAGKVFASKEIIISGGAFNSPQLLLLSGIGPKEQLNKFKIPVAADSLGVGRSVADNYEAGILSLSKRAVTGMSEIFPKFWKTSQGATRDIYVWCGSFAFEGFWPGFLHRPPFFNETYGPSQYECALVHMNPRSQAGVVELRSADPRDLSAINLNFVKEPGSDKDLQAIYEGVEWVRSWLSKVNPSDHNSLAPFNELRPCEGMIGGQNCTVESKKTYIKEQAYSHHASSSARIGSEDDKMAVFDSMFWVCGVDRLRVVDASSFPKVPGGFPVLPTMMLSEKATDDVLAEQYQNMLMVR